MGTEPRAVSASRGRGASSRSISRSGGLSSSCSISRSGGRSISRSAFHMECAGRAERVLSVGRAGHAAVRQQCAARERGDRACGAIKRPGVGGGCRGGVPDVPTDGRCLRSARAGRHRFDMVDRSVAWRGVWPRADPSVQPHREPARHRGQPAARHKQHASANVVVGRPDASAHVGGAMPTKPARWPCLAVAPAGGQHVTTRRMLGFKKKPTWSDERTVACGTGRKNSALSSW